MRPVLITGANGTLGEAFRAVCSSRGLACRATSRAQLDITDECAVGAALDEHQPWLVINAAGYVRVDEAERDAERCRRENVLGPMALAERCRAAGVLLACFSSDLVFDGRKRAPYEEGDEPAPLGVYGRTKLEAEGRVLEAHPEALVIRTSAFFGPWDRHNFLTRSLADLVAGREVRAAMDVTVSPTYLPDLAHACLDLAIDEARGVWHLSNVGATTWADLARTAARLAGLSERGVVGVPSRALELRAPRPVFSALGSARGAILPPLESALHRFLEARS